MPPRHDREGGPVYCGKHKLPIIAVDDQCRGIRVFAVTEFRISNELCDLQEMEHLFAAERDTLPDGAFSPAKVTLRFVALIHIQDTEFEQRCGDLAVIRGGFAPYEGNAILARVHSEAVERLVQYRVNQERRAVARANLERMKSISKERPNLMTAFQRLPVRYEVVVQSTYASASEGADRELREAKIATHRASALHALLESERLEWEAAQLTVRAAAEKVKAREYAHEAVRLDFLSREYRLWDLEALITEEIQEADVASRCAAGGGELEAARASQQLLLMQAELRSVEHQLQVTFDEERVYEEASKRRRGDAEGKN